MSGGDFVPELTTCHSCRSTNTVTGEPGGRTEALCRDCGVWFDPLNHPAGCFYGSFAHAYPDAWHVPAGATCDLPHGEDAIHLTAAVVSTEPTP